jgi:hypothetical protein
MTKEQIIMEMSEINMRIQILRNRICGHGTKYLNDRVNVLADLAHTIDEDIGHYLARDIND